MCKRITFSHLLRTRRDWLDMSIASIILGLSVISASAPEALGQCQPPTPCACAADGMCYPKRDTWGNYTTHWRPYPGESLGLTPTPTEGGGVNIQDKLPTFIVPTPDKEDQRGPVRPTRPAATGSTPAPVEGEINDLPPLGQPLDQAPPAQGQPLDEAPPAQQGEQPAAEEAPAPQDNLNLPGFGPPQSLLQPLPETEDGLPLLPSALSQAITMGNGAAVQANFPTRATATAVPVPTVNANSSKPQPQAPIAQSTFVSPAAANIELSNPAAKKVQKTMDQDLQQAIYYEASDIDSAMK